jgi:thioredoxin reductase (NADPH)
MPEKVVIIGSGPAGWTAAIYASRAQLQPLCYEGAFTEENRLRGLLPLGQLAWTTEVENFPGFPAGNTREYLKTALQEDRHPQWIKREKNQPTHGINGPELMELMRQQAINFGTRVVTDDIVELDLSRRPFTLTDASGKQIESHSIIIATGASANYLGLPSENRFKNMGVSACAVCDGALPRFRDQPLIVVGGGDSAAEEGNYLTKFASVVYLVHRRDHMTKASKIMAERLLGNPKVKPIWNSTVDEVLGDDERGMTGAQIKNLQTGESQSIDASGMFVAIGHTPNTEFLRGQVQTNELGFIVLKDPFRTTTSVEGVFAAGDVADPMYKQAVTAAGMGCKAALDAERWLAAQGVH